MIDTDKYKIEDDVVWVWKDDPEKQGWVLWEYKECSENKGGNYTRSGITYEPLLQVLPALVFECEIDEKMQAITDLPLIVAELKRLQMDNTLLENNLKHTKHKFIRVCERKIEVIEELLAEIKELRKERKNNE
tara:strand:- start:56 stop:454 length:399 start_codon:yes stop_codon:yes gene_type:complete